jgi:hypothetical protein
MSQNTYDNFAHYEYAMESFLTNQVESGEFMERINEYAEAGWRLAFVFPGRPKAAFYTFFERSIYYEK